MNETLGIVFAALGLAGGFLLWVVSGSRWTAKSEARDERIEQKLDSLKVLIEAQQATCKAECHGEIKQLEAVVTGEIRRIDSEQARANARLRVLEDRREAAA